MIIEYSFLYCCFKLVYMHLPFWLEMCEIKKVNCKISMLYNVHTHTQTDRERLQRV